MMQVSNRSQQNEMQKWSLMSDILELLYSSEEDGQGSAEVAQVPDKASQPKCAQVNVQGVQGVLS